MKFSYLFLKAMVLASAFGLVACENGVDGGGSIGGGNGATDSTVVVSGKVSLLGGSSTATSQKLSTKEILSSMKSVPDGRPGSTAYYDTRQTISKSLNPDASFLQASKVIDNATVYLYDAEHPEWLYPVAESSTDSSGNYLLKVLRNSSRNLDSSGNPVYSDGDYIPEGNYTLLAFKSGGFDPILGITTDPVVAVQTVVNTFSGTVSAADLVAQSSTAKPKVETIIGLRKNTDGTATWGNALESVPGNAAIPVTFSMAMSRASVLNGVSISPAVDGEWRVSADWLSAIFYPSTPLTEGNVYTVTVSGLDTAVMTPVTNVYGNPLKYTATATFTAGPVDLTSPNVFIVDMETPVTGGTKVEIFSPIRIASDEPLDVNSVSMTSTPSLGVKPGVFFVGQDPISFPAEPTDGKFIYEFLLAEPLDPGTTYSISVSAGTDMSGNPMVAQSLSFTTVAATSVAGINPAADAVTQEIQADVINVFGRWIRALNDRSIGLLQEMMTGDYIMEYDVSAFGPNEDDLNRDGRMDLEEFSAMVTKGFSWWNYCQTSITGVVVGNVNINAAADGADFQFDLTFDSAVTSQNCNNSPGEMFATLYNINGKWQIAHVSEGIDTRNRTLVDRSVISGLKISQNGSIVGTESGGNIDGATLFAPPINLTSGNIPVEFGWNAVDGATAYVFYIVNARDESRGRAFILPATQTTWKMPVDNMSMMQNYVKVHWLFGFGDSLGGDGAGGAYIPDLRLERDGEEYYWTVMALDTNVPSDFDAEQYPNGEYNPNNSWDKSRATDLFQQISAISHQYRFKTPGIFKEISVDVSDTVTSQPITYSEIIGGYDAGASSQVTLKISTPYAEDPNNPGMPPVGQIYINGHSWNQVQVNFAQVNGPNGFPVSADATVTLDLFEGWNWIDIWDGVELYKSFSVQTTGGIPPIMKIISVFDQSGNDYTAMVDAHGYLDVGTNDVKSVLISGTIVDSSIIFDSASSSLNMSFWNDLGIYDYKQLNMVVDATGNAAFTVEVPVYKGNNWINFNTYYCDTGYVNCDWAYAYQGVRTTTGTPWTPPIHDIKVDTAVLTDDYGQSQNWDASNDLDDKVTISGVMEYPTGMSTPWYNISSEGDWRDGQLSVNADGSFSIPVTLYNGWNYVNINDGEGNWFGITIYTAAGKTVIKPQIDAIDGVAYNRTGFAAVDTSIGDGCYATITGQALANSSVNVNWSGDDGAGNYYYESVYALTGTDNGNGLGDFTAIVPVLNGYNYLDVFDMNWRGTYVQLSSSTQSCATYVQPAMSVDLVTSTGGATGSVANGYTTADSQVAVSGVTNIPGRQIVVTNWTCTGEEKVVINASITDNGSGTYPGGTYDWSVPNMNVYQDYNWLDVTDGYNYQGVSVYSTTTAQPSSAITPAVTGNNSGVSTPTYSGCNYQSHSFVIDTSVTISGTTTAPDGEGIYWDVDGTQQKFAITGGVFSFTVNIYDGYNYLSMNDTNYNYYSFDFSTSNGVPKPRVVDIQSHVHDSTLAPGTYVVSGIIDSTVNGFVADRVNAYVYDAAAGMSINYTNDVADQDAYGYSPITMGTDPVSGQPQFNFSINVTNTTNYFYISVDAVDEVNWVYHGHSIYINNIYNYGQWSYKPGAPVIDQSALKDLKDRADRKRAENVLQRMRKRR